MADSLSVLLDSRLSTGILESCIAVLPTVSGTQWLPTNTWGNKPGSGVGDADMYIVP